MQIGLPGPIPTYAEPYLRSSKIRPFVAPNLDLSGADPADIIHRPSQPSGAMPLAEWRERCHRVVVTLHDLIAYQVLYSGNPSIWSDYRRGVIDGAADVDGVIVVSDDTRRHVDVEALPLEPERMFVVPGGTDHLSGAEDEEQPRELGARGFLGAEFLLVWAEPRSRRPRVEVAPALLSRPRACARRRLCPERIVTGPRGARRSQL